MNKYITKGTVSAVLGVGAFAASITGKSALATFLSNPDTGAQLLAVLGGFLTLFAGASAGVAGKVAVAPVKK